MKNRAFNSISDLLEYKKYFELSNDISFIHYLNSIYSNLLLREDNNTQSNFIIKSKQNNLKISDSFTSSKKNLKISQSIKISDKGISLKTFLEYMDIQEFIGERIYKFLNNSKSEKLNKAEFSNGLNKIYYSDIKDLIKFTFFLCDFNEDGKIYRSDIKLILAYIPSSSEFSQKLYIKQIKNIVNKFFDEKIDNPKEGEEKEIDYNTYSNYILEYKAHSNKKDDSELINDYNGNAPFFYFISILSYLYKNCPYEVKNVEYFNQKIKHRMMRNSQRSSSIKNNFMTAAKKNDNSKLKIDFEGGGMTACDPKKNKIQIDAIPKIGQKNLFKVKRSVSQRDIISTNDLKEGKNYFPVNNKKRDNNINNNKDYIVAKNKIDIKSSIYGGKINHPGQQKAKLRSSINYFTNKMNSSLNITNVKKKDFTTTKISNFLNEFSQSPQIILKDLRYSTKAKVKLPSIVKNKNGPMSVGFKFKMEDKLEEPSDFVLDENVQIEGGVDSSNKNLIELSDYSETFMYKYDKNNLNQQILNKCYGILSGKEILFFESEQKNELLDIWYIYKSYISIGKEIINNTIYYTINITFFNNNFINKLYFIDEFICEEFAKKIKKEIHDLNFDEYYEIKDKLGFGNFATVNKCIHKESKEVFAVKMIDKEKLKPIDLQLIEQEKNYLSLIKHPNILSIKDYFEDKKFIYIITECCNGGDLLSYIERHHKNKDKLSEKEIAKLIKKIAEGIKYLNIFGIVHRDIKPENILFTEQDEVKSLKIIDLGVCETLTYGQMANEPIGTMGYISPEIYLHKEYSFNTDIWSLGVILYMLITEGILPFDNENADDKVIGKKVVCLQQEYPEEYFGNKSKGLINLLDKMLEKNIQKRINVEELLKDSWFNIIKL